MTQKGTRYESKRNRLKQTEIRISNFLYLLILVNDFFKFNRIIQKTSPRAE